MENTNINARKLTTKQQQEKRNIAINSLSAGTLLDLSVIFLCANIFIICKFAAPVN